MKTKGNKEAKANTTDLGEHEVNVTIDLTEILEDCMGDIGLLEELIRLYKQNALEFIGTAKIAIMNADFTQLKLAAHKIKCGLSMMHTYELRDIAIEIHAQCETHQNLERIKFLDNLFKTDYLVVERAIDRAFEKLGNIE